MPTEAGHDLLIGQSLSHYRIVAKIGAGGMGEVYRAQDQHLEREVAIKVLPLGTLADESLRRRFRHEALALSRLNHPNIATVHDFDTQRGLDFLVMEYIHGATLTDKLAQASLPEKQIIDLGTQLAEGLCAAHEHHIVHCDLKPGNLMLSSDGRLKILDFGLAKLRLVAAGNPATETIGETHALIGTLPYMAPEQVVGGEIDARTDIHAAGAVLYEMATGRRPFATVEQSKLVAAILRSTPAPLASLNPSISPELARIIGKCLEKDREERYQSARELLVDLRRLARAKDAAHTNQAMPTFSLRGKLLGASAAALLAVLLLAIVFLLPRVGQHRNTEGAPPALAASIAVLPFADLSPSHDHQYFCEGLAEEILNKLTKIPSLKVAARTSAFQFSGQNQDLRMIGERLNVADILEGSVQREGNRVRIAVRLTKADVALSLWSESYDRDFKDIFAVEDDIATAVASALQPALLGHSPSSTTASPTTNADAYQVFLEARYFARRSDSESERKAFADLDEAIHLDPNYAPPYALRGVMTAEAAGMGRINDLPAAMQKSRHDAEKALTLDPNLASGYLALSEVQAMVDWDWRGAEQSVRKARELAPGDADALAQSGFLSMSQGRLEEAVGLMNQGVALDPLQPAKYVGLAQLLRDLGRLDAAHAALDKALELNPQISVHAARGEVYLAQGRPQEALAEMEKEPESAWRDFGEALAYHALGRRGESDAALARLVTQQQNIAAYQIAEVHAYRGEATEAFDWLDRACRQRDWGLGHLKADWLMNNLRSNPRYFRLLKQVNLPE